MPTATRRRRVALQGFSEFERNTLATCFRLAGARTPAYELVGHPGEADLLVADADQAQVVQRLTQAERLGDTVFVGSQPPEGAIAWLPRPIDPVHLLRELDALPQEPLLPQAAAIAAIAAQTPGPAPRRTLPLPEPAPAAVAADDETEPPAVVDDGPAPLLIVDDSEIALRFLEVELQALGLRCEQASDSGRALAMIARHPYQALLLDVELGDDSEIDGLMLCQQVKRAHRRDGRPAPAVVMLSAHAAPLDRVRGTFAGCDAYLGKPLDRALLRRTLVSLGVLTS